MAKNITGVGQTARTMFIINTVSLLAAIALLITCIIYDTNQSVYQWMKNGIKIATIVVATYILMSMAGTFFISTSLRKSLKAEGKSSGGKTAMLFIIWVAAAFYLIMFIISMIWNAGLMDGDVNSINICLYIAFAMPLVTFILSAIIYSITKRA